MEEDKKNAKDEDQISESDLEKIAAGTATAQSATQIQNSTQSNDDATEQRSNANYQILTTIAKTINEQQGLPKKGML